MTLVNENPSAAVGDMVSGQPNVADNTEVPTRLPVGKDDVLALAGHRLTTRSDGTCLVGDAVSGMPKLSENRSVPTQPPVMWNADGSPADPKRPI